MNVYVPAHESHYSLLLRSIGKFLAQQTFYERDETKTGAKLTADAWKEALYLTLYENECQEFSAQCVKYFPLSSGLFSFSPHWPGDGQIVAPYSEPVWYTGADSAAKDILLTWQGQLLDSDVLALPLSAYDDLLGVLSGAITLNFPKASFNITGEGELEIKFIKIFQGGAAMVVIDGDFLNARFVDLSLSSFADALEGFVNTITGAIFNPVSIVDTVEFLLEGEGEHTVEIWFLPKLELDNPFDPSAILGSGWGGGIRLIELCGKGYKLEFRQNPVNQFLLEYRENASADWLEAFDYSVIDCDGDGGGGDDDNTPSLELSIQLETDLADIINIYNSSPGTFAPELDTWSTALDAALCLAIRFYVEGVCEARVSYLQGERRKRALAGGLITTALIVVGAAFSFGTLTTWAWATAAIVFAAAYTGNESLATQIGWLRNTTYKECVVSMIYAQLNGAKPTLTAFRGGANAATLIEGADYVRDFVYQTMQPIGVFVSWLKTLAFMKTFADDGLIGNDCMTNYDACLDLSWSHTIDFTVDDGGFVVWSPAPRGFHTNGVGWQSSNAGVRIWRQIPRANVTTVQFNFQTTGAGSSEAFSIRVSQYDGSWTGASPIYTLNAPAIPTTTDGEFTLSVGDSVDYIGLYTSFNSMDMIVTSCVITGTGVNPFI